MAIQSQFYKDMSKYEPPFMGSFTKTQIKMILQSIPGVVAIVIQIIFVKGLAFWILSFFTGVLLLAPPILIAQGKWAEFKKKVDFSIKHQERVYQTGQIRRYEKHEFIPEKGVKETDEY